MRMRLWEVKSNGNVNFEVTSGRLEFASNILL
jgi:hypothetical protein